MKFKWSPVAGTAVSALLIALIASNVLAEGPITVSVNAPSCVSEGAEFIASVNTTELLDLSAPQFDVTYDPAVLQLTDVTDGELDGTTITTEWEWVPQGGQDTGHIRVLAYAGTWAEWETLEEVPAATGAGSLAEIHFTVIGTACQTSDIVLSDGIVADSQAAEIPANWVNASVLVFEPGDANTDCKIDSGDLLKVLRIILEMDPPTCGADANQDGRIDSGDLLKVLKIILAADA